MSAKPVSFSVELTLTPEGKGVDVDALRSALSDWLLDAGEVWAEDEDGEEHEYAVEVESVGVLS